MQADISGDGRTGTVEVVAASQFISQEREVKWPAMGQEVLEEIVDGFRPGRLVIASGGSQLEARAILQPLMAQGIKAGRADHQPLGGGESVKGTGVEGLEDFLNVERGNAVSQLLFFIGASVALGRSDSKSR